MSPQVIALIDQLFVPFEREAARELVEERCGMNLPLMNTPAVGNLDRIQLAVVKLSNGSLRELHRHIGVAQVDWRDVLVAAGQ
jgi:hypothetical protein